MLKGRWRYLYYDWVAEEGILRAQFFDDQEVGPEEQLCQTKNARGFNGFLAGGFRWLASGAVASAKWLPWLPQKNPTWQDRDSVTL